MEPKSLKIDGGIQHFKSLICPSDDMSWFSCLTDELPFKAASWKGKPMKREVCGIGPEELDEYPTLERLMKNVRDLFPNRRINGIFCNRYRTGEDYTPYHQDSYDSNVFNISFGETRDFLTKSINGGSSTKYTAENGDIIVFTPDWNADHLHSVPVRKRVEHERISIVAFIE